jgi:hypothetical protein
MQIWTRCLLCNYLLRAVAHTFEDVNISIAADVSSLKFIVGIYFSRAPVETLKCTGNRFDDKLIVGTLTSSEE